VVEDCTFGDGNGMITCGSEATIVRDVTVRNCVITGNATLLTLKLRPDTPQHYERILIENIELSGTGRILNVAPWRQFFDLKGQPAPKRRVNDITLRNIKGRFGSMGALGGNPGDTLEDITLENIDVELADASLHRFGLKFVEAINVKVNGKALK
jgi:polygalacturonase